MDEIIDIDNKEYMGTEVKIPQNNFIHIRTTDQDMCIKLTEQIYRKQLIGSHGFLEGTYDKISRRNKEND